jgi:hypothetical protein
VTRDQELETSERAARCAALFVATAEHEGHEITKEMIRTNMNYKSKETPNTGGLLSSLPSCTFLSARP